MTVSKRFIYLLTGGIALLVLLALVGFAFPSIAFGIYNLVLIGLLTADYYLTPAAANLVITREEEETLSHGTSNRISFTVSNPTEHSLAVAASDTPEPRHFGITAQKMVHRIDPGDTQEFYYEVTASKRGAYLFPHIFIKVRGILGLVIKYKRFDCKKEYKVYPNLKDLNRFRILIQKNRLLAQGEKTIRLLGGGTEFEGLRNYVEGDDYRKINWLATARENRLIVNDFQTEKNQPVFMLIDGGRPMSYNVKGYKKLDYAINAALVLSDIVNQKGDQSGLLVFDRQVRKFIAPGKGALHRNAMLEALYHIEETHATSNYEEAFRTLCEKQKRRGIVFIFTDFETLEEAKELTAHIALLRRRHFPIVVFMKNEGLKGLENDPDPHVREVAQHMLTERKQLFRTLNAMRIPNIETEAENFSLAAVNRYLGAVRQ